MLKRVIAALMAVVMVFAAVPVNVVAEEYNAYDFYKINDICNEASPYFNGMFMTCTLCGGTVYLYCTGVQTGSYFTTGCSISRHNPAYEDPCSVEHIMYRTTGYCTNTECNFHDGVTYPIPWPYETQHEHTTYHRFYDGYEQWGSCIYLA